ncbi:Uncharacterized protein SCF082_LOCUS29111 [Durusdinium trenchii]
MRAPALGALALVALASALREEQAGGTRKDVPRRCSKGWSLGGSECCSCGDRMGSGVDQDLEVVLDHCEWEDGDAIASKTCCPVWTRDCKENEPEFKKGLKRDCVVTPEDCAQAQCADVAQQLRSAKKALKALIPSKSKRPSSSTLKSFVTGKSNAGKTCHCGCGEISSLDPLQCQNSNDASWEMYCRKTRPCCSDPVKDCKEEDPWPKALEISQEVEELESLWKECFKSCKVAQQDACVEDLKAEATSQKSGWTSKLLGKKKKSNQEVTVEEYYAKLSKKVEAKELDREKFIQELRARDKARNRAKNAERREQWKKEQFVKLSNFVAGVGSAVKDLQGKDCCKCQMIEKNKFSFLTGGTLVTDFCSAASCDSYQGKCSKTSKNFCKRSTACPADHAYYARALGSVAACRSWEHEEVTAGLVLLSISLAPVLKAPDRSTWGRPQFGPRTRGPGCDPWRPDQWPRAGCVEPKYVGLTPQEVAFAEEVLHEAREKVPMDQHGPDAGLVAPALRRLHEVVEADDFEALPAAISAAEAVGVEVSELRFARAVLQQRKELRRTKASEALQRVVASGSATTAVKLTTALAMAKVAGVCARDLNAAEELLKTIREADLRHPRKSALACAHSRPKEGKCLRFAPEVETVFFSA